MNKFECELAFGNECGLVLALMDDGEQDLTLPVTLPTLLFYLEHSKNKADFESPLLRDWIQLQKKYIEDIERIINDRRI